VVCINEGTPMGAIRKEDPESGERCMLWVTRDERPRMMDCDAIALPMLLRSKDRPCMPGPGTDQSVQVNNYGVLVLVGIINHGRAVVDMHLWPKYVPPSGTCGSLSIASQLT